MAEICPNCERITLANSICFCGVSQTQLQDTTGARWIVHASEPFAGSVQSHVLPSGTVAYSGGETFEAFNAARGGQFKLVSDAELDALLAAFHGGMITEPAPITGERFMDALECLPPCRWGRTRGIELFHVSEGITGDLVDWFAAVGGKHWHFVDRAGRPASELAEKVATAAGLALA